jgi:hypothetical protein
MIETKGKSTAKLEILSCGRFQFLFYLHAADIFIEPFF